MVSAATTLDDSLHVVHDGNAMLGRLLADLGPESGAFDEHEISLSAGRQTLVLMDLRRPERLRILQAEALACGAELLFVGTDGSHLWLGPYVVPGKGGCVACLLSWLDNNYRNSAHWSHPDNRTEIGPPADSLPLPSALHSMLASQLRSFIGSPDDSRCAVTRIDLRRGTTSRHEFLPNAYCGICAARPPDRRERALWEPQPRLKATPQTYRTANPKLTVDGLRRHYVDRHMGLVRHVFNSITSDLMPMYTSELPIMFTPQTESGYGRTDTRQGSEMVAILEALERYAGHLPRAVRAAVRAPYREVADRALPPEALVLHDAVQREEPGFQLSEYSPNLPVNWVWGRSFQREAPVLVPEQSVYYYLLDDFDGPVNRFVYETSSGCALGGPERRQRFTACLS